MLRITLRRAARGTGFIVEGEVIRHVTYVPAQEDIPSGPVVLDDISAVVQEVARWIAGWQNEHEKRMEYYRYSVERELKEMEEESE